MAGINAKTEQENQNIETPEISKLDEQSSNHFKNLVKSVVAGTGAILIASATPPTLQAQNNTPKTEKVEKQNIDFASYLGKKRGENYTKLKADKRQIFEKTYNQILRDNGETFIANIRGKEKEVNTSKGIKAFMRNLCSFLYNLDAKEIAMVKYHKTIMKQIEKGKSMGLNVNDDIMFTLYGLKVFAEQIDKEREGWLNTPLKREKELREIQKRIAELEKNIAKGKENIANLDKDIANLDKDIAKGKENIAKGKENIKKLDAELEVLKVVAEGLKAMKDI